jgi:hypothetical protein
MAESSDRMAIAREFDGKQLKMRDLIQIGDANIQFLKDGMRSS